MGHLTAEGADDASGGGRLSGDRIAFWVFCAALVIAVPVLFYSARDQWFFLDEWDFLADRDLMSLNDLLRPHNEHWHSLGIVIYRLIYQVVGTRSYWPYLVPVITAHLASVALLRILMRRAGVDAWIATTGCIALLFLGSGHQDILWGFQIGFTGSVALGLAALLLASRSGSLGWRDLAAVAASLVALTASTIGVAMVGAVGVACLLRRQWTRAALQVGVPALVFAAWYLAYGRDARELPHSDLSQGTSFVRWLATDSFEGLAGPALVALLLAVAAGVGIVVAVRSSIRRPGAGDDPSDDTLAFGRAGVVGLSCAACVIAASAAYGRAALFPVGPGTAPSRYIHLVVVTVLPATVLGLTAAATRIPIRSVGVAAACLLLLVGLPGNIDDLELTGTTRSELGHEESFSVIAGVAVDLQTPPHLRLPEFLSPGVTAGWLREAVAAGDLDRAEPPYNPEWEAQAIALLSLDDTAPESDGPCTAFAGRTTLEAGDVLQSRTPSLELEVVTGAGPAVVTQYARDTSHPTVTLRAVRPIRIRSARPTFPGVPVELCLAS